MYRAEQHVRMPLGLVFDCASRVLLMLKRKPKASECFTGVVCLHCIVDLGDVN